MPTIATFWSINTSLQPIERYHLGQLSVALYADAVVRKGGQHLAVICDNDALTNEQYSRVGEISAAISSLCAEPLTVRTLTSFRINMESRDRAAANRIASEVRQLREEILRQVARPAEGHASMWRIGDVSDDEFIRWAFPGGKPVRLRDIPNDHLAGLLYIMLAPPIWFEAYWIPAMLFAIGRITEHCSGPIDIVEGIRNRYPWHAVFASMRIFEIPQQWQRFPVALDLRPNVKSDSPFKSMCVAERNAALLVHSTTQTVIEFCERSSPAVLTSIASLILGHNEETLDQRTIAVELASTVSQVQSRWIFGPERKGALRVTSAPATSRAASAHPVISIHGVLSRGVWQKELVRLFAEESIPYDPLDLGFLLPTAVLLPFISNEKARKVADRCSYAENHYKTTPSLIAHSFGTLVVQTLLRNYHWIRLDKVILSGSILPVQFDWLSFLDQGRIKCVVNLVASKDNAVRIGATFCPGLGPSGTRGFACEHPLIFQPVSPNFGHSDWFAGEAFGRVLVPMLEGDVDTVGETLKDWPSTRYEHKPSAESAPL